MWSTCLYKDDSITDTGAYSVIAARHRLICWVIIMQGQWERNSLKIMVVFESLCAAIYY